MQSNLKYEQKELTKLQNEASPDEDLISESNTKIDKLNEGIQGWTAILNYIDSILARAAVDDLEALTGLMPQELMDNAKHLDRSDAPDAAAELETYNAISFTGGGHSVSWTLHCLSKPS